jgi:hypothetical protein
MKDPDSARYAHVATSGGYLGEWAAMRACECPPKHNAVPVCEKILDSEAEIREGRDPRQGGEPPSCFALTLIPLIQMKPEW